MPKPQSKAQDRVINQFEIDALKQKNTNIMLGATGISILGNVAGLMYAIQTKKSGWGKVGWFFLGGIIIGIPAGIVGRSMVVKNNTKIGEMETNLTQTKTDESNENKALDYFSPENIAKRNEKPDYSNNQTWINRCGVGVKGGMDIEDGKTPCHILYKGKESNLFR